MIWRLIMKIYILLKHKFGNDEIICASYDVNKIRSSLSRKVNINEDYIGLEIWENEELIYKAYAGDVLRKISSELVL